MTDLNQEQKEVLANFIDQAEHLGVVAKVIQDLEERVKTDADNADAYALLRQYEARFYQIVKYLDEIIWYFHKQGLDANKLAQEWRM